VDGYTRWLELAAIGSATRREEAAVCLRL